MAQWIRRGEGGKWRGGLQGLSRVRLGVSFNAPRVGCFYLFYWEYQNFTEQKTAIKYFSSSAKGDLELDNFPPIFAIFDLMVGSNEMGL